MRYTKRPPPGDHLFTYLYEKPADVSRTTNVEHEDHEVMHGSPSQSPHHFALLHRAALGRLLCW